MQLYHFIPQIIKTVSRFCTTHLFVRLPITQLFQFLSVVFSNIQENHLIMMCDGTINHSLIKASLGDEKSRQVIGYTQKVLEMLHVIGGGNAMGMNPIVVKTRIDDLNLFCIKASYWSKQIVFVEDSLLESEMVF